jgi:hypothetical protein
MKTAETKVVGIHPSETIGKFVVILKPNPFPLHPRFRHFQLDPDFENISTETRVDHLEVYTATRPSLTVGQAITIHYELRSGPKKGNRRLLRHRFDRGSKRTSACNKLAPPALAGLSALSARPPGSFQTNGSLE